MNICYLFIVQDIVISLLPILCSVGYFSFMICPLLKCVTRIAFEAKTYEEPCLNVQYFSFTLSTNREHSFLHFLFNSFILLSMAYSQMLFMSSFSLTNLFSFFAYKLSKDFKNYIDRVHLSFFGNALQAFSDLRDILDDMNSLNSSMFAIHTVLSIVGYSSYFHYYLTSTESSPLIFNILIFSGFLNSLGGFFFAAEANSKVRK